MIAARASRRSGITLTEILIAILIMAVGLISLATLFPLGLLRLREATRLGRAGTTVRSAADDIDTRGLLYKPSFQATWYGQRDPFVQDADATGTYFTTSGSVTTGTGVIASGSLSLPANNVTAGNTGNAGDINLLPLPNGLPICYDPLWRAVTGVVPNYVAVNATTQLANPNYDCQTTYFTSSAEARFGAGLFYNGTGYSYPYLGNDLTSGNAPSAYGLQRLTNFIPWSYNGSTPAYGFTYTNPASAFNPPTYTLQPADVAGNVFTSIDDIVFNEFSARPNAFSSLVPDMTIGIPQADYRFSWFFTGRQTDANGNGAQFTGDIVVCDSRPFGFDPLPGATGAFAPTGETVVEAIYGYGGNSRAVLLRWNNNLADPPLRVGGWICDTTYERDVPTYRTRAWDTTTPFVRCYWYQISKRTDPAPDLTNPTTQRSAVVTLATPVRVVTTHTTTTKPHSNVALIMPSVINVFPRAFEVH